MSREAQAQAELERREIGRDWCREHGHTCLQGEFECYVCGEELTKRMLQLATDSRAPIFGMAHEVYFVGASETFRTPEGTMRASNGVCRCGRRGHQHAKMYPWKHLRSSEAGMPPCEGYEPQERGGAPDSDRVPRVQGRDFDRRGPTELRPATCICGHLPEHHENDGACARCPCWTLAVR